MIIPMLCVTIFVILVVWFLLPRVARLMIHTPTAISIFVCLSMVQLMDVFISLRCTLCGHFLQVALTVILVVGYALFFFQAEDGIRDRQAHAGGQGSRRAPGADPGGQGPQGESRRRGKASQTGG